MSDNGVLANVNPVYYTGSLTVCDNNWHYENIRPGYEKFYYISDGECVFEIDGEKYNALPGQLFLLPVNSVQTLYTENGCTVKKYWFHCALSCGKHNFTDFVKLPVFIEVDDTEYVESLFCSILAKNSDGSLTARIEQKADILKLLAYYIRMTNHTDSPVSSDGRIAYIISYIEDNLNRKLTLKELSSIINFNPSYFIRFFKSAVGCTPLEYIQKCRIEKAQKLILDGELTVQEIGAAVGFGDSHYFSRYFKKSTGFSPTVYREYSK